MSRADPSGPEPVTQDDVTEADKAAVTRFHAIQIKRIMAGDSTLGEDGRQTIEQAFAERRLAGIAEGRRLSAGSDVVTAPSCAPVEVEPYFTLPFALHEAEGNGAAYIRDAKGQSVAMLMWPAHAPNDEDAAVATLYAIGRAFAAAFAASGSDVVTVPSEREIDMMIVLERIAELLGSAWLNWDRTKIIEELGDEITPFFEGLGMSEGEGPDGQDCYGFDWTAEQERVVRDLGGRKAIIHRLALATAPTPTGEGEGD
ncbi:hypothetical protein SAMN05192583_0865 [Sphingomonas gellani]|uniref:Uncharacterized protein n=1 Tax=Sphingomonas gellani TaxID=1166340 RepID=A0A1H7ZUX2_9SPHN|nr:hypothetical protein [Sphingomonas gellani]SEM62245.1 hypothetical protein SAMN05192583_0865 [Sphingomonas gellani]